MQREKHFLYGSSAIHGLVYLTLHSKLRGDYQYNLFIYLFICKLSISHLHSFGVCLPPSPPEYEKKKKKS